MLYLKGRLTRWIKWRACDAGEAKEGLENELRRRWSDGNLGEWAELILQPFRQFTYDTAHSPTLQLPHLRHSSFSNPSFASPASQALHLIHLTSRPWTLLALFLITFVRCSSYQKHFEFSPVMTLKEVLYTTAGSWYSETHILFNFIVALIRFELLRSICVAHSSTSRFY